MKKLILVACLALPLAASSCSIMGNATEAEGARIEVLDDIIATGTPEEVAAAQTELDDLEDSIAKRAMAPWAWLKSFLPDPLEPLADWILGAGGLMIFDRPRKRVTKMVKSVGSGVKNVVTGNFADGGQQIGDAFTDIFKTIGLMHSNSDPIEVMRGAAKAARAKGDEAMAVSIETKIAELQNMAAAATTGTVAPTV